LENNLKNEKLKNAELGKNINKFETMVKELTETRILSPPPKKDSENDIKNIPQIIVENKKPKNPTKKSSKSTSTSNKTGKKSTNSKKSNNSSNSNDSQEWKQKITALKNQNSKVVFFFFFLIKQNIL